MPDILGSILARKREEVAALDVQALRRAADSAPAPRDFLAAVTPLSPPGEGPGVRVQLIAELKRASPSKGPIAPDLDLLEVADIYAANGAAAISVLTDETFFGGSLNTVQELRFGRKLPLPLLRKDFIVHEAQVYQSRVGGADAILLIAAALPDQAQLSALHALALELGLSALVEVHRAGEVERALQIPGLRLIGINNRDLGSFKVSLETTEALRPLIPAGIAVVAESGIFAAGDVARLANAGVDAVLVGEALMTAPDIGAKVRELSGFDGKEPSHHEGHEEHKVSRGEEAQSLKP
jgi:indole-3-glycerol phosphate synthase